MSRSSARRRPLRWSLNKLADQSRNYPKQLLGAHLRWVPSSVALEFLAVLAWPCLRLPSPQNPASPASLFSLASPASPSPRSDQRPPRTTTSRKTE